jgi:hypothetical protein
MEMVTFLFVYGTALVGTVVLVPGIPLYLIVAASDRQRRSGILVPLAMIGGFLGGILFIWS